MARFYFDVHDGADLPDATGLELPDAAAARTEAERLARELLAEMPDRFERCDAWTVTVSNAQGVALFVLRIACGGRRAMQWETPGEGAPG